MAFSPAWLEGSSAPHQVEASWQAGRGSWVPLPPAPSHRATSSRLGPVCETTLWSENQLIGETIESPATRITHSVLQYTTAPLPPAFLPQMKGCGGGRHKGGFHVTHESHPNLPHLAFFAPSSLESPLTCPVNGDAHCLAHVPGRPSEQTAIGQEERGLAQCLRLRAGRGAGGRNLSLQDASHDVAAGACKEDGGESSQGIFPGSAPTPTPRGGGPRGALWSSSTRESLSRKPRSPSAQPAMP